MRRHAALLAALLSLAAGCSQRERLNPLDPGNPETGGGPVGFNAVAGFSTVTLTWTVRRDVAIEGYQLLRLAPGDSVYRGIGGNLPPGQARYLDSGIPNSGDYRYRLLHVVAGAPAGRAAEDVAGPGPARPWVVDAAAGQLVRLSPDGRDILVRSNRGIEPFNLAVSPRTGTVWIADPLSNTLQILDSELISFRELRGLQGPYTIAISPRDETAWVCELNGGLAHVTPGGMPAIPARIDLLDGPTGVAVHPADHSVWVAEQDGDRVRHYTFDGVAIAATPLASPTRVAVDSVSKNAWVTSLETGRIHRLNELAQPRDSLEYAQGPIGIAVDWRRDRVWVADAAGDAVLLIETSSRALLRRLPGIGEPREVSVDLTTGECWVVARSERAVYRLAPDGSVRTRIGGFTDPVEVRVDPGSR